MELFFLNILLIGAFMVIWLLIRAVPRAGRDPLATRGWFERWLTSDLPSKIDAFSKTAWVRALRRFKVLVLRLDNGINEKLQRMKLESGDGIKGDRIDLKKVVSDKASEASGAKDAGD